MQNERKIQLCSLEPEIVGEEFRDYHPINISTEKLLAEYFNIDLNKVEQEKQAILKRLRKYAEVKKQGKCKITDAEGRV